jgi:MFS family permease
MTRGVLGNARFRLVWLSGTASAGGDTLVTVAYVFAILEIGGSPTELGIALGAHFASRVGFLLIGGVVADRLPRRGVMIVSDLVRASVQAFLAVALFTDFARPWHFAATSVVYGAALAFYGPASTGLVAQIVEPERLQEANALVTITRRSILIVGPAVGGIVIAAVGNGAIFALDAATFLVSALLLSRLRAVGAARHSKSGFFGDLAGGWHEVKSRPWLLGALVTFGISNLTNPVFFVLGPIIVRDEFGGAREWGFVLTAVAVGGFLGGMVGLRAKPVHPLRISFPVVLPVSLLLLALIPPVPFAVVLLGAVLAYTGVHFANVLWQTAVQVHVPHHALARVSSYDYLVSFSIMPLGYALVGPISSVVGTDATLVGAAALGITANTLILALPSVRSLTRMQEETVAAEGEPAAEARAPAATVR